MVHIKWLLYYQTYRFSVFELDARHNLQVMAPNTNHSFFPISHLCLLTYMALKLQVIYGRLAYQMSALQSETFLVWFTVAWEIRLKHYCPRYPLVILWYKIVCVYCKPVYTLLFRVQLCMMTKIMYFMLAYYTLKDDFTANDALFYKCNGWLATLPAAESFHLIMYANIKITKSYYRSCLWVCCQAAKRNIYWGIKVFCQN